MVKNIQHASLSMEDVFMKLRHHGIEQLGQVKIAYLEHDGYISVYEFKSDSVMPGLPIVPPRDISEPTAYSPGQAPTEAGYYACLVCGEIEVGGQNTPLPDCPRCHKGEWTPARLSHTGNA